MERKNNDISIYDIIKVYILFYTPMCIVYLLLYTHVIPDNNITQTILTISVCYALLNTFAYFQTGGRKNEKQ